MNAIICSGHANAAATIPTPHLGWPYGGVSPYDSDLIFGAATFTVFAVTINHSACSLNETGNIGYPLFNFCDRNANGHPKNGFAVWMASDRWHHLALYNGYDGADNSKILDYAMNKFAWHAAPNHDDQNNGLWQCIGFCKAAGAGGIIGSYDGASAGQASVGATTGTTVGTPSRVDTGGTGLYPARVRYFHSASRFKPGAGDNMNINGLWTGGGAIWILNVGCNQAELNRITGLGAAGMAADLLTNYAANIKARSWSGTKDWGVIGDNISHEHQTQL